MRVKKNSQCDRSQFELNWHKSPIVLPPPEPPLCRPAPPPLRNRRSVVLSSLRSRRSVVLSPLRSRRSIVLPPSPSGAAALSSCPPSGAAALSSCPSPLRSRRSVVLPPPPSGALASSGRRMVSGEGQSLPGGGGAFGGSGERFDRE